MSESDSPGDLVAVAERFLEKHPHASLATRAAYAVVVASGGDEEGNPPTFDEVAAVLDEPVDLVTEALWRLDADSSG